MKQWIIFLFLSFKNFLLQISSLLSDKFLFLFAKSNSSYSLIQLTLTLPLVFIFVILVPVPLSILHTVIRIFITFCIQTLILNILCFFPSVKRYILQFYRIAFQLKIQCPSLSLSPNTRSNIYHVISFIILIFSSSFSKQFTINTNPIKKKSK